MRVIAIAVVCVAGVAHAAKHPRFEPTDLELENPGTLELDLQLGAIRGPDASRIVVPDFEIDLGILPNLELGLDGAFGVEGVPSGTPRFLDHAARENLWASLKIGVLDHRDASGDAIAVGFQIGPKLPVAPDAHGIGVEGVALVGRMAGRLHLVGQIGALVDPRTGTMARPYGIEGGIDLELDLDARGTWTVLGELGAIWYGSPDASQLATTAGIQYALTPKVDVSVVGMVGVLAGSDPYGILLGISPKLALW